MFILLSFTQWKWIVARACQVLKVVYTPSEADCVRKRLRFKWLWLKVLVIIYFHDEIELLGHSTSYGLIEERMLYCLERQR